mmetsp:Transcript_1232/g.2798  ORF Transcript_1232/g.2798 Transcript_1232/m.2798 type:complete len:220 (+) Transcript_1232:1095-1754(+)
MPDRFFSSSVGDSGSCFGCVLSGTRTFGCCCCFRRQSARPRTPWGYSGVRYFRHRRRPRCQRKPLLPLARKDRRLDLGPLGLPHSSVRVMPRPRSIERCVPETETDLIVWKPSFSVRFGRILRKRPVPEPGGSSRYRLGTAASRSVDGRNFHQVPTHWCHTKGRLDHDGRHHPQRRLLGLPQCPSRRPETLNARYCERFFACFFEDWSSETRNFWLRPS